MKLQKIGTGLLAIAFILFWMAETGYSYGVLIVAGILDLYLEFTKKQTISQWIQSLTDNKVIDYSIMGVLLGSTIYKIFLELGYAKGFEVCLPMLIMFLAIHFFGNKD